MSFLVTLGFTIGFIGQILLAISVYIVHNRIGREKKIDKHIVAQIHKEKYLAVAALVLIVLGFILELPGKLV